MAGPANTIPSPLALAAPGLSEPGAQGDAASGSMLAQLRKDARRKQKARTVTVDLPPIGGTALRATYGAMTVEELERLEGIADNKPAFTASLELAARACRKIEAQDSDGNWWVLEDDIGPVTFDDRLTQLLGWDRPDDEFRYPVAKVYEGMFAGDGLLLAAHLVKMQEQLGLSETQVNPGESTSGGSTRSAPRARSGSTRHK